MTARTEQDHATLPGIAAGVRAATGWLLAQLDTLDDSAAAPGIAPGLYRVPHALALAGHRPDAARVLTWLQRHVLDESGDLRDGPMRTAFSQRWSSYPLAILAQAAWHLERFDIAEAIRRTLHDFQDPQTGGAYAQRPELRTHGRQDLFPTAQLGITGLTMRDDRLADGAYRWLRALYALQPDLPSRLYTGCDGARLLCEPDDVDRDRFGLVTAFDEPRQAFYNPGIAAAFLARYSAQRADPAAHELADAYLALSEDGGPAQFDFAESVQICKFGWGAAALLDLSPQQRYLDHAERMARWFLECQQPDGHWQNSPFLMPDGPTVASDIEVTAEFIQHLMTISTALAGCQRAAIRSSERGNRQR